MGQLVLLVVAAAWAAVLVPPLLRSRIENRPNSSVSDFRDQLSSLQRAMPPRSVARSMARPLAQSPLSRPAATGRPALRSNVRPHNGAPMRHNEPAARRRLEPVRTHDATPRARSHASSRPVAVGRDAVKRRRANVLFVLVLTVGCTIFLAATTRAQAMVWVALIALFGLLGYVCLLGRMRQRDLERTLAAGPQPVLRRDPVPPRQQQGRQAAVHAAEVSDAPARRGKVHRHAAHGGRAVLRQPASRRAAADRWSHAV